MYNQKTNKQHNQLIKVKYDKKKVTILECVVRVFGWYGGY